MTSSRTAALAVTAPLLLLPLPPLAIVGAAGECGEIGIPGADLALVIAPPPPAVAVSNSTIVAGEGLNNPGDE